MRSRITSRSELLKDLFNRKPELQAVGLRCDRDRSICLDTPNTYNIANNCRLKDSVARTLLQLHTKSGATPKLLETLFVNLTSENTAVGYLSQLQAYDWLLQRGVKFSPEVEHTNNIRGKPICIDGRIETLEQPVFFDVKSLGFEPNLRDKLRRRLEEKLVGYAVTIDGPGNHSQDDVRREAFDSLNTLVTALTENDQHYIESLDWSVTKRKREPGISFAEHEYDPNEFIRKNLDFPLKYASQFATDAPFLLFFWLPDGVGSSLLKKNVFGFSEQLFAGIATHMFGPCRTDQRAANQFDSKVPADISVADVAARLSALVFHSPQANLAEIHLNNQATSPLTLQAVHSIASAWKIVEYH